MTSRLLLQDFGLTEQSYYEASATRVSPSPPLKEKMRVDVCVVGAGFAGLSTALELRARGYSVAILEARIVGWGASGRNGGQALVGYASEGSIEGQLSDANAKLAWDISVEGLQLIRNRIKQHQINCDFVSGYMSLAVNARKGRELDIWVEHLEHAYDYRMQKISPIQIKNWIASKRFYCGVFDSNSGHLHPLKYCLGLARAALAMGIKIFENSAVTNVVRNTRSQVKTALGQIDCAFVVLAGNVYLNEFGEHVAPELNARIMPVGTYIIATEPMGQERCEALICNRAAVCDTNFALDYFRPTADHRILFGGGVTYSTSTPSNILQSMRKRMLAVFPQLSDLNVPFSWGGFVDITMNRAPDFGRLGNNIYYLHGFSGHGVALTGIAGKLVAQAISGQAERFDTIAQLKHRNFPGGKMLRTPALVLGALYYRLRDILGWTGESN